MTEVPATNATTLNYADLVREGKRAVAAIDAAWWGLAELADKIDTVYREHTLEDFRRDTGATCSLERRLTVWRCWKSAPRPILDIVKSKYAVARVLSTHPERANFISQNPNLTTREAEAIMRRWRGEQPKPEQPAAAPTPEPEPTLPRAPAPAAPQPELPAPAETTSRASTSSAPADQRRAEIAGWWRRFINVANLIDDLVGLDPQFVPENLLRDETDHQTLPRAHTNAVKYVALIEYLQSVHQPQQEAAE